MKVTIDQTEWYPIYVIEEDQESTLEIPQELITKFNNNLKEFTNIQNELRPMYLNFLCKNE